MQCRGNQCVICVHCCTEVFICINLACSEYTQSWSSSPIPHPSIRVQNLRAAGLDSKLGGKRRRGGGESQPNQTWAAKRRNFQTICANSENILELVCSSHIIDYWHLCDPQADLLLINVCSYKTCKFVKSDPKFCKAALERLVLTCIGLKNHYCLCFLFVAGLCQFLWK